MRALRPALRRVGSSVNVLQVGWNHSNKIHVGGGTTLIPPRGLTTLREDALVRRGEREREGGLYGNWGMLM